MEKAIEEFMLYTNHYIQISDNRILKIEHTTRVMNLCEEIEKYIEKRIN